MILYSSLRLLDSVDFEIRNTIIPELGVRLGVSDLPFLPTQLGFILTLILRTTTADTQIRLVLLPHNFCLWVNQII
jgi:hypothetical protein